MVFEALEPRCLLASHTFNILGSDVTLDSSQFDDSSFIVTLRQGAAPVGGSLASLLDTGVISLDDGSELGYSQRLMDGIYQVMLTPGVGLSEAIALFQADTAVLAAEPNWKMEISTFPTDPAFADQWGLDNRGVGGPMFGTFDADIDAPEAWSITTGSGNFVVAVIDSGVDYTHPDLKNNMWRNLGEIPDNRIDDDGNGFVDDVFGWDFGSNDSFPLDELFHGTHVAGTIAAQGDNGYGVTGVAWRAKIMALKIGDNTNSVFVNAAIAALDYAVKMGAKVSNNSYGGPGFNSVAMHNAIARARAAGHIFVAAAGNSASNNDLFQDFPSGIPLDNVVSVAAMDRFDRLATFSNFGATTVDIGAPGVAVLSTFPTYATPGMIAGGFNTYFATIDGTSMATPHVTGAIALLWDKFPSLTYNQVIDLILNTATPVSILSGVVRTGGRLNVYDALLAAGATPGSELPPGPIDEEPEPPPPNPNLVTASNTVDVKIPDNGGTRSTITVSQHIEITDIDIWIDIRHPAVGQLRIDVYRPGYPVPVILSNRAGGNNSNFSIVTFDDEAATAIATAGPPFDGSFRPQNPLTAFDGQDAFGEWRLVVTDMAKGLQGVIAGWGFTINGNPILGLSSVSSANVQSQTEAAGLTADVRLEAQQALTTSVAAALPGRLTHSSRSALASAAALQYRLQSASVLSPDAVDRMFDLRREDWSTLSSADMLDAELSGEDVLAGEAA